MDKVKFYTHYDCPVCDCESYEPGTSLTVPDQVEPVSVTVRRCLRGEILQNVKDVYYENDGNTSIDEAFDRLDPTTSPGFDLADVPSLVESAQQADMTASQEAVAEPKGNEVNQATESKTESSDSSTQSNE